MVPRPASPTPPVHPLEAVQIGRTQADGEPGLRDEENKPLYRRGGPRRKQRKTNQHPQKGDLRTVTDDDEVGEKDEKRSSDYTPNEVTALFRE